MVKGVNIIARVYLDNTSVDLWLCWCCHYRMILARL